MKPEQILDAVDELSTEWGKKYRGEWEKKKGNRNFSSKKDKISPIFYSANSYMKRSVYEVGANLYVFRKKKVLEDAIELHHLGFEGRRAIYGSDKVGRKSPFYWLINMVYATGEDGKTVDRNPVLSFAGTAQERLRISKELHYALKHNVPTEYLIGFINQAGGSYEIIKKLNAGEMEKWIPDRIAKFERKKTKSTDLETEPVLKETTPLPSNTPS